MKERYRIKADSVTDNSSVYQKGKIRLSVLTDSLLRIEWSETKNFVDMPTQKVWKRNFPHTDFSVTEEKGETLLETKALKVYIKSDAVFSNSLLVVMKSPVNILKNSWASGESFSTLGGTARTLDRANGAIPLEKGILSREGFTVLDDSDSYLIEEDGTLSERKTTNAKDLYFFGYGHSYRQALKDYFTLTGFPPLLPRYALGNWWSRYYAYTQEEYLALMNQFKEEGIPLSVAMIDMDWHKVNIDPSIGTGWTGYSWNRELFPQPENFLSQLHEKKLHVSLNVHPAEGVGRHEDAYEKMKGALGQKADGSSVTFDITNPAFIEAYFECLHHPLEKEGVDFWWIDWQQGNCSSRAGLDPLWLLNHYHYLDNKGNKKRPLILSRYAGPGSHRYPIGFSGDTVISWESLNFQPYFTITAANIGYGWWSHDIGGHMLGTYDEELQVRWAQWGVFSPIMRLHSSASPFNHKEPWHYGIEAGNAIKNIMRLRHRLIPYTYTMNRRFAKEGRPLLEPLYYEWPYKGEAYDMKNEYYFGSELLCAPVTEKMNPKIKKSKTKVWLPQGLYTDFFTGRTYQGDRVLSMYRSLDSFPLLLKSGAILPLMGEEEAMHEGSAEKLPETFDLYIATGSDGAFSLYEDSGDGFDYEKGSFTTTDFTWNEKEKTFTIHSSAGDKSILPQKRKYTLHFMNCDFTGVSSAKENVFYSEEKRELQYSVEVAYGNECSLTLCDEKKKSKEEKNKAAVKRAFTLLDKMQIDFLKKESIFAAVKKYIGKENLYSSLLEAESDTEIIKALIEQIEND